MIASGPAYPDSSTCRQAMEIADTYRLRLSEQARSCLKQETPKALQNVTTCITGSVRQLWTAKPKMEREQADLIHDRMSGTSLFLTGFFAISCVGCTLQLGSTASAGSDWLVSLCYIAGLLSSCGMFAKRKELEMIRLENPEKPRA
jgi:hypothetical protein